MLVKIVSVFGGIYLLISLALIFSQYPQPFKQSKGLDFSRIEGDTQPMAPLNYAARDGGALAYRHYGAGGAGPLVVVVHGSGAFGAAYDGLARDIAARGAEVLLPDLRGHGTNPKPRGDVAYVGQLEDDLMDLIKLHLKKGQKLVLLGHSSGGGLVARFAGGQYGDKLDKAVLLAPFLKYNAPTTRENSGGWVRVLTRRVIGLSMLNNMGITLLNHMVMIQFNFPDTVRDGPYKDQLTDAYSFALNTSYAPRNDYLSDIKALPKFALIVGDQDEAFFAGEYQPLMSEVTDKGQYFVLKGVSHLGVSSDPQTKEIIATFLND